MVGIGLVVVVMTVLRNEEIGFGKVKYPRRVSGKMT